MKNLADAIQSKWVEHIKREKDSAAALKSKVRAPASAASGTAGKPSTLKTSVKSLNPKIISPVLPLASLGEKKTVTAISYDIFKSNPAASLPKIKKSDKPVIRKSPDASPIIPEPSKLAAASMPTTSSVNESDSKGDDSKFSYRRAEQVDFENKRKLEVSSDVPKKKRKSVRFKPDDSLKEIKYYVPDSSEMVFF